VTRAGGVVIVWCYSPYADKLYLLLCSPTAVLAPVLYLVHLLIRIIGGSGQGRSNDSTLEHKSEDRNLSIPIKSALSPVQVSYHRNLEVRSEQVGRSGSASMEPAAVELSTRTTQDMRQEGHRVHAVVTDKESFMKPIKMADLSRYINVNEIVHGDKERSVGMKEQLPNVSNSIGYSHDRVSSGNREKRIDESKAVEPEPVTVYNDNQKALKLAPSRISFSPSTAAGDDASIEAVAQKEKENQPSGEFRLIVPLTCHILFSIVFRFGIISTLCTIRIAGAWTFTCSRQVRRWSPKQQARCEPCYRDVQLPVQPLGQDHHSRLRS